jgi:hypothetical protein
MPSKIWHDGTMERMKVTESCQVMLSDELTKKLNGTKRPDSCVTTKAYHEMFSIVYVETLWAAVKGAGCPSSRRKRNQYDEGCSSKDVRKNECVFKSVFVRCQ